MVPIVGLEPTYSRFLNSFKAPSESLNGILDAMARALANSYSNGQINRFAIFHPLKPTKGGLKKRAYNSVAPASRWWVWLESNQLPRGGPCPALPSATYPYGCLSLQTVTEIFTRRFSQRRSLLQHSGGFLFLCEVAPLFRGSRALPLLFRD